MVRTSRPGRFPTPEPAGNRPGSLALPSDLGRALRYLDDAQLDRLLEAASAEARRRGRQDGKTAGGGNARKARSGDARAGAADPGGVRSRPQAGGDRSGVSPVARPGGRRRGRREAASPLTGFLECTEAGPCAAAHARSGFVCPWSTDSGGGAWRGMARLPRHDPAQDFDCGISRRTVHHATHVAQRGIAARTRAHG